MATLSRIFSRRLNTNLARVFISTTSRSLTNADTVTHTGQVYEKDDYKRVRFTNREKTVRYFEWLQKEYSSLIHESLVQKVNEQFAINLIDEEPPIEVDSRVVWCDGGHAALGHPKVYINLDQEGPHACGYCGLRYVMKH